MQIVLVNVLIMVADFFLDAISISTVFLPVLIPIMTAFGRDPVWFGVVITLSLAICTITPPIAVNLYVASNISGASMEEVSRWILPGLLRAHGGPRGRHRAATAFPVAAGRARHPVRRRRASTVSAPVRLPPPSGAGNP